MFPYVKSYKPGTMKSQTFVLETKTQKGIRGERIHKVVATSLSEAIKMFAQIKQLRPDQLVELFSVYEQHSNGR